MRKSPSASIGGFGPFDPSTLSNFGAVGASNLRVGGCALALLVKVMARRHEVVMSFGRNCDMKRFPESGWGRKGRVRTGKKGQPH